MKLDNVITVRNGKTIYRDGDKVIKLFEKDFPMSDVLNEALNQSRVVDSGLRAPKILEVATIGGKLAIVMEFIKGKGLDTLILENPNKKDEYLNLFVDLQLEMHGYKVPLLNKLKDKMNRKIDETTLDANVKYELNTRLGGMPKHTKLCHGDFNPSNIIVGDDGKCYILDWSHATQGNASADAARTYLLFKLAGDNEFAEKYIDLFCKKSETERQYVDKWLPIVAASQSVKGKPEEREFLLKWVNVVEFE